MGKNHASQYANFGSLLMFADRGHIKIYRKRSVSSEPFYVTLDVTEEDRRDVLGIFNIPTEKRNRME